MMDGWVDELMVSRRMNRWMVGWVDVLEVSGQMDGWMGEVVGGWVGTP